MKYKGILLALVLLILACSMQSAFAEDVTVDNHTFTMPDNYVVMEQSNDKISIGDHDNTNSIVIAFNIKQTPDQVKKSLEDSGEKFIDSKTVKVNGYDVTQMSFEDDNGYYHYIYICKKGDETIGINLLSEKKCTDIGDNANPATGILSSLKP